MPAETNFKILIVEDEADMLSGLRDNFEYEGYQVLAAKDGEEGLRRATSEKPDLVILDVMLPKMSGTDVCKKLRARSRVPILMLTARGQEIDKVAGLEVGADDYVTKPFSIRELLARVKALLRRSDPGRQPIENFSFGSVTVDFTLHRATRNGKPLEFSTKELDLLRYFILHRGETLSRDRLLEDVWGYENYPTTRTVDTHVMKLRQKVEEDASHPRFILTLHGTGYKFVGAA
jgi:two-component system alkaline phosphatase synthesis response regulator PhoP